MKYGLHPIDKSHLKIFRLCLFAQSNMFHAQLNSCAMHECKIKGNISLNSNHCGLHKTTNPFIKEDM
jgi:hypothetical protein